MKDKNGVVDTTITPRAGPFRVGRGSGGEPFSIEAATRTIALVKTDCTHTEGNANLLAASSDLLSACRIGIKQGHEGNLLLLQAAGIVETVAKSINSPILFEMCQQLIDKSQAEFNAVNLADGKKD